MTPKERAAMQQALECAERCESIDGMYSWADTITALREALAEQAEQEPDYFGLTHDHTWLSIEKKQYDKLKPEGRMACYAAPVRTKDLTDDELREMHHVDQFGLFCDYDEFEQIARAVIAKDREKNK